MTTHTHYRSRRQPSVNCWFCSQQFTTSEIERDGIIRSRRQNLGGPYRLLVCPQCSRENICEKSPRGRWFASPNMRVSIIEYFVSHLLDTRPEDFLAAACWFRENEARRRYFFERDGDMRYSGRWRNRFWPQAPGAEERGEERGPDASRDPYGGRRREETREKARKEERERPTAPEPPPRPGRLLSPHEILGIPALASAEEIRSAFRRLARQCHPDKVYHLGEEAQRLAHEKFTRLKAAYDALIVRRGEEK